jgi:hypothetical protein
MIRSTTRSNSPSRRQRQPRVSPEGPRLPVAAAALAALLAGGCEGPVVGPQQTPTDPPGFLIGGQPDFAHDYVGAVVTFHPFIPGNPLAPFCTGTLIAPTVVVTAGHCAFLIEDFGLPVWFTLDQQFSENSLLIEATAIPHPDFVPTVNPLDVSGLGGDPSELGVLILDDDAGVQPALLPTAGLLDQLRSEKLLRAGAEFTVLGYGISRFTEEGPLLGERLSATMPFGSLLPTAVQLGNHSQRHTPSACFGDSGGPNFFEVDGAPVLTSVTWWLGGGPLAGPHFFALNCASWHRAYRLDTPQARSFLGTYVALP